MKLSNVSVIFIIIVLPILLILSYYISLQIDTISMQTSYTEKQLSATKQAISAFEINTVEWNEKYSTTADSKRRDIQASVDTLIASFANSIGVGGASKETILPYIPAITFTMYDGFYIYAPSTTKEVIKDENGVAVFLTKKLCEQGKIGGSYSYVDADQGKLMYKYDTTKGGVADGTYNNGTENIPFTLDPSRAVTTEFKHILKPYIPYAEQVTGEHGKYIINYTLDNYVTVYGVFKTGGTYTSKSGFLNVISDNKDKSAEENGIYIANDTFNKITTPPYDEISLDEIYFNGQKMEPELLSEVIAYDNGTEIIHGEFYYVYEAEKNSKVYYDSDSSKFFVLDNDLSKVYVENLMDPLYKKCTLPCIIDGKKDHIKVYQDLATKNWYIKDEATGKYTFVDKDDGSGGWKVKLYEGVFDIPQNDFSAINYCVETYVFTNLVNSLDLEYPQEVYEYQDDTEEYIPSGELKVSKNNDPDSKYSDFSRHKRKVIKDLIMSNLGQAITSYSENSVEEYQLPVLTETEWEQVLSNISAISFIQNIPIGLKYYNNYAIATSTFNKEYVDPDKIYIYDQGASDTKYHLPYCNKLTTANNLIGYRSIDSLHRSYENVNEHGEKVTTNYFKHRYHVADLLDHLDNKNIDQLCYYCLVQRELISSDGLADIEKHKDTYYTALARERFLQLELINISTSNIEVTKEVSSTEIDYGDSVTYTITIKNEGLINDYIHIADIFDPNQMIMDISSLNYTSSEGALSDAINDLNTSDDESNFKQDLDTDGEIDTFFWQKINIAAGEEITITYSATITGDIGATIKNTAIVYSDINKTNVIAEAIANAQIVKYVEGTAYTETENYNLILVLDHSSSMAYNSLFGNLYNGINTFVNQQNIIDIFNNGESEISVIEFSSELFTFVSVRNNLAEIANKYSRDNGNGLMADILNTLDDYNESHWGTNYNAALRLAINEFDRMNENNKKVMIFFTDGFPTPGGAVITNWIGYAIQSDGRFRIDGLYGLLEGYGSRVIGNAIWGTGEILNNGIVQKINALKSSDVEIYAIDCTDNNTYSRHGLQNIIASPGEGHYEMGNSEEELAEIFRRIAANMATTEINIPREKKYETVELTNVSAIKSITIGTTEYPFSKISDSEYSLNGYSIYPNADDTATINLNDFGNTFKQKGDIKITY
jgi:hypothetical protein